jgi:hypothetical protein
MERLEELYASRNTRRVLVDPGTQGRPLALAVALAIERGVERETALESATTGWSW